MCILLRELRWHGVGHQRRWVLLLLGGLRLGEGERGVSGCSLCTGLGGSELRGLEVVLASEGSRLVEVGLSVTVVAAPAEAVAGTVAAPVAAVL